MKIFDLSIFLISFCSFSSNELSSSIPLNEILESTLLSSLTSLLVNQITVLFFLNAKSSSSSINYHSKMVYLLRYRSHSHLNHNYFLFSSLDLLYFCMSIISFITCSVAFFFSILFVLCWIESLSWVRIDRHIFLSQSPINWTLFLLCQRSRILRDKDIPC